jgi:hypothetical protein
MLTHQIIFKKRDEQPVHLAFLQPKIGIGRTQAALLKACDGRKLF